MQINCSPEFPRGALIDLRQTLQHFRGKKKDKMEITAEIRGLLVELACQPDGFYQ